MKAHCHLNEVGRRLVRDRSQATLTVQRRKEAEKKTRKTEAVRVIVVHQALGD